MRSQNKIELQGYETANHWIHSVSDTKKLDKWIGDFLVGSIRSELAMDPGTDAGTSVHAGRLRMAYLECCKLGGKDPESGSTGASPGGGAESKSLQSDKWGQEQPQRLDDESREAYKQQWKDNDPNVPLDATPRGVDALQASSDEGGEEVGIAPVDTQPLGGGGGNSGQGAGAGIRKASTDLVPGTL